MMLWLGMKRGELPVTPWKPNAFHQREILHLIRRCTLSCPLSHRGNPTPRCTVQPGDHAPQPHRKHPNRIPIPKPNIPRAAPIRKRGAPRTPRRSNIIGAKAKMWVPGMYSLRCIVCVDVYNMNFNKAVCR